MAFERQFSFQIDGGPHVASMLAFSDDGQVHIRVRSEDNEAEARWLFDVQQKTMQFSVVSHHGRQAICLATCLGKAIGKPLLECLLSSRSIQDVGKCLDEKAIGAYSDAVVCIGLCLGLV